MSLLSWLQQLTACAEFADKHTFRKADAPLSDKSKPQCSGSISARRPRACNKTRNYSEFSADYPCQEFCDQLPYPDSLSFSEHQLPVLPYTQHTPACQVTATLSNEQSSNLGGPSLTISTAQDFPSSNLHTLAPSLNMASFPAPVPSAYKISTAQDFPSSNLHTLAPSLNMASFPAPVPSAYAAPPARSLAPSGTPIYTNLLLPSSAIACPTTASIQSALDPPSTAQPTLTSPRTQDQPPSSSPASIPSTSGGIHLPPGHTHSHSDTSTRTSSLLSSPTQPSHGPLSSTTRNVNESLCTSPLPQSPTVSVELPTRHNTATNTSTTWSQPVRAPSAWPLPSPSDILLNHYLTLQPSATPPPTTITVTFNNVNCLTSRSS